MQKAVVTRSHVEAYERVRASGRFNMLMDSASAIRAMGMDPLDAEDAAVYMEIIRNYSALMAKFNIERK